MARGGSRASDYVHALLQRVRRVHWRRLNHILIPDVERRLRLANTRTGRVLAAWTRPVVVATPLGRRLMLFSILAGIIGLDVTRSSAYLLWCVLMGLLISSYVTRSSLRLANVRIEASCSSRVYAGQEVRVDIAIHNDSDVAVGPLHIEGPFLPWDGAWLSPPLTTELVPSHTTVNVTSRVRFSVRGPHTLEPFVARALTPFGLFGGPGVASAPLRFLVVPRPVILRRALAPSSRRHHPGGVALASRVGESPELLGIRPYRPGDRLRDLHARSWARHGEPVVRLWQEEYFARSAVLVDIDETIAHPRQLEAVISLAAGIVSRLGKGEALVDLLVVGDAIHKLTIGRHVAFEDRAIELLACVKAGPALRAERIFARLRPHLDAVSTVVAVLLSWDDERARIVSQIRAGGIYCRAFVVAAPRARPMLVKDPTMVHLATEAVEKGEV